VSGARCRHAALVLLIVCVAGAVMFAQRGRNRRSSQLDVEVQGNTPYDGRFTFVRLKYNAGFGRWANRIGNGGIPWSHDYPDGEVHFSKILEELTLLRIRTDGSNILALDDPELFNYPIAYMAEPGLWGVTESEAVGFRNYLLKGGFAIFDDFRGQDWDNLQYQMKTSCRKRAGSSSTEPPGCSTRSSRFRNPRSWRSRTDSSRRPTGDSSSTTTRPSG